MKIPTALRLSPNVEKIVDRQFRQTSTSTYLNSGCCGRKPHAVLDALSRAHERLNHNPCHLTFNDSSPSEQCRAALARLLAVNGDNLFLALSTTNALQILMQSFLLEPGDEFVMTSQEHGSMRTIARYLSESRGIVVKVAPIDGDADPQNVDSRSASHALCQRLLALVTARTKLLAVSEIVSYTGFRPDYSPLRDELAALAIPLLADCAHGPGQIICRPDFFPLWIGSGHKWLGGPNGTAFAYVSPELVAKIKPLSLSDTYYDKIVLNALDLRRLEGTGTADGARWSGLSTAVDLHVGLSDEALPYQFALASYLRRRLQSEFQPTFRLRYDEDNQAGDASAGGGQESTSIVNFRFTEERLSVANLQDYLWQEEKIAVQLDYLSDTPGLGMRVSCHVSNTIAEVDRLLSALKKVVIK